MENKLQQNNYSGMKSQNVIIQLIQKSNVYYRWAMLCLVFGFTVVFLKSIIYIFTCFPNNNTGEKAQPHFVKAKFYNGRILVDMRHCRFMGINEVKEGNYFTFDNVSFLKKEAIPIPAEKITEEPHPIITFEGKKILPINDTFYLKFSIKQIKQWKK